MDNLFVISCN